MREHWATLLEQVAQCSVCETNVPFRAYGDQVGQRATFWGVKTLWPSACACYSQSPANEPCRSRRELLIIRVCCVNGRVRQASAQTHTALATGTSSRHFFALFWSLDHITDAFGSWNSSLQREDSERCMGWGRRAVYHPLNGNGFLRIGPFIIGPAVWVRGVI